MVSRYPLFGCTSCYEECSWPADDLREHDGELWCDQCWGGADMRETTGIGWGDLPAFVPDENKRIAELEAQLTEARAENERLEAQLAEVTQSRDAWYEEGLKWAQNSDFWREKYEALTGQGGEG